MTRLFCLTLFVAASCGSTGVAQDRVGVWTKYEKQFESDKAYENPLYDVKEFAVRFVSPSGRAKKIHGFWDGGQNWKVRFCPDENGIWTFETSCSNTQNSGLHGVKGTFECAASDSKSDIHTKGAVVRPKGCHYLTHADGTPFFFTACTAWNGALKSTEEEWLRYLKHRAEHGYNVIQFVTTQWRGCDKDAEGRVAFEGSGRIRVNPDFYKRLDRKVDQINEHGLVAAPVLLWALPVAEGRELSPGYYLPDEAAILLARYMVARYGGHHVIWILGGDGRYIDEYEQRWKNIGRGVFGDEHPGVVAQHPQGHSWIGNAYANEDWLDLVGYQSSHSSARGTVDWITKGPMAKNWDKLPARPTINLEPCYEGISSKITEKDVRNASYWSILATPTAGITYGANGIWPWIREGETILNHGAGAGVAPWHKCIDFPASIQIGYLAEFMRTLPWWRFKPAPQLLVEQPGDKVFNEFISVSQADECGTIVAYVPVRSTVKLFNPFGREYEGEWFSPVANDTIGATLDRRGQVIEATSPRDSDMVLVLHRK